MGAQMNRPSNQGVLDEPSTGNCDFMISSSDVTSKSHDFRPTFKIVFYNVQSITSKVQELELFASGNSPIKVPIDIFCFSEHWLCEDAISAFKLEGYAMVGAFSRRILQHGGVALFVSNMFQCEYECLDVSTFCRELHCEFAALKLETFKIIVVVVYRSPNGDLDLFLESLEGLVMSLFKFNYKFVVGGDFNVDIIKQGADCRKLEVVLKSLNIYLINRQPTRGLSCLDNIATDLHIDSGDVGVVDLGLSDHDAVYIDIAMDIPDLASRNFNTQSSYVYRPFTQGKLCKFIDNIQSVDWLTLLDLNAGAELLFNSFHDLFIYNFNLCFPEVCKKINVMKKPSILKWFTPELEAMRKTVLSYRDIYRVNGTPAARQLYVVSKRRYRQHLKVCKLNSNAEYINNAPNKCSAAWKIIRREISVPSQPFGNVTPDNFNDYFLSVAEDALGTVAATPSNPLDMVKLAPFPAKVFDWTCVTERQIVKTVSHMKNSLSKDIYGLSNSFIKQIILYIAKPLELCLNACLSEGIFPSRLKVSKVTPLFKKGDRSLPSSYRPISNIPIFAKIFESIIKQQVIGFFEDNGLLADDQFGFRAGRSTISAVDRLIGGILDGFERRLLTGVTLCDLSKAFDCVSHQILINKLAHYGIVGRCLELFKSYLGGREQLVFYGGGRSRVGTLSHGVPQGSVLGPLLFLIMVNDLPFNMDRLNSIICYADDTTLIDSGVEVGQLRSNMERSLELVSEWFRANQFLLNLTKTQSLIFNLGNHEGDVVNLLGIRLDSKLTWNGHVNHVCGRLARVVYLIRRLKECVPLDYLKTAYYAFFQSIIMYGLCLWGCSSNVKKVLLLQKKAIRAISGASYRDSCRPFFIELKIMTVINLYIFVVLTYIKNAYDMVVLRKDVHDHYTRKRDTIDTPFVRLTKSKNSQFHQGIVMLNKLPLAAHTQDITLFKRNLRNFLLAHPFYTLNEFMDLHESTFLPFF